MIKHFIIDEPSSPGGRIPVFIVSSNRDELLMLVDQLAAGEWTGRLIYYDVLGGGGVDLLVTGAASSNPPYEVRMSRSISWSDPRRMAGHVLAEEVRNLLATYLLRGTNEPPDEGFIKVAPTPDSKTLGAAPKMRSGQMAFF